MNKGKFVTPVSEAGVPHHIGIEETPRVGGLRGFEGMTNTRLARLYWNVRGVRVRYAFEVNGRLYKGGFEVKVPLDWGSRVTEGSVLEYENEGESGVVEYFYWDLGEIYSEKAKNGVKKSEKKYRYDPILTVLVEEEGVLMGRTRGGAVESARQLDKGASSGMEVALMVEGDGVSGVIREFRVEVIL